MQDASPAKKSGAYSNPKTNVTGSGTEDAAGKKAPTGGGMQPASGGQYPHDACPACTIKKGPMSGRFGGRSG
jgi:hypothetical protein